METVMNIEESGIIILTLTLGKPLY